MDTRGENLFQFSAREDAKQIFSRRKLAILWKSKLRLRCKILLFLCLFQQSASSSRPSCLHLINCIPLTLKCSISASLPRCHFRDPKNTSIPSLIWGFDWRKKHQSQPRAGWVWISPIPAELGLFPFLNHTKHPRQELCSMGHRDPTVKLWGQKNS